jgi:hypothetical protein
MCPESEGLDLYDDECAAGVTATFAESLLAYCFSMAFVVDRNSLVCSIVDRLRNHGTQLMV